MTPRIAVLVSGKGTLLEALLAKGLPIVVVLADRPCRGMEIAQEAGITPILIKRPEGMDIRNLEDERRQAFTNDVAVTLISRRVNLIIMAGFMTIFSKQIFIPFRNRILNAHPSLLPRFKGAYAVRAALASGAKETGCTVYLATENPAEGPVLARSKVRIYPEDTEETLQGRITAVTCELYPKVVRDYLERFRFMERLRSSAAV